MVKFQKARQGYKFEMTAWGFEHRNVRAKFEKNSPNKHAYEKAVPTSWVEKQFVQEVLITDGEK